MCRLYNNSIKNTVKENESLKLAKRFLGSRSQGAVYLKVKKN